MSKIFGPSFFIRTDGEGLDQPVSYKSTVPLKYFADFSNLYIRCRLQAKSLNFYSNMHVDFLGSQTVVTIDGFELRTSCMKQQFP